MTEPRQLVVISGKGGTGKTSLLGSFALLAGDAVLADCDVDAADLHLLLTPEVEQTHAFVSGHQAIIRADDCTGCGVCAQKCRFEAIVKANGVFAVDPLACEGCGVCFDHCPAGAIDFPECECGQWFVSRTRAGAMVHARLYAGAENSGKLVARVREQAKTLADESGRDLVLVDGPPGVGCPVIAAVGGASMVLIVTEPTVSGRHDLARVLDLSRHFNLPAAVAVNKWDLNPDMAAGIEDLARRRGAETVGRVRYDPAVTQTQMEARAVVERADAACREDVETVYSRTLEVMP